MHQSQSKKIFFSLLFLFTLISGYAQVNTKQKGLLWEITGNGLKKPSYVYGTMHISQKLAFHLGDSFYNALLKCDMVALEQNLDSVIHRWISEDEEKPEDANKVHRRSMNEFLGLTQFQLGSFNKDLIERKLSAEVREVNYLLKRGNENDFEEDAWLDLYIYQIGKRTGKQITGVEGYEESRDLVEKSNKEPEASKAESKKKLKPYSYKMREQVAEAYRKGNIFMIDSIDRMTESEHFREYMLYKRNANMVRRMDSIVKLGKTLFTGVGCAHLPGNKGVLQMLIDKGYQIRPVQSITNEKSKLAQKYEDMTYSHDLKAVSSDDGLITANLPTRLTKVRDYESYASYLCPDLANGYYYQIEKISSNLAFSGKTQEDVLLVIDTMTFENIPGEQKKKERIISNGFPGIEVVTELKTGDLNRFHILVSPYNVYIIRMAGKKKFASSSVANNFFKTLKINEGVGTIWQTISSSDSIYSLQLPSTEKSKKLIQSNKANPSFEHIVYDKTSGNTYVIKQVDILNTLYLEQDTFELGLMAKSFCKTDDFVIKSRKHFVSQGYNGLEVVFETKKKEKIYAKFYIAGTRYIMFLLKPNTKGSFEDKFFTSLHFNGKPNYNYSTYKDTNIFFTVSTPQKPYLIKEYNNYNYYNQEEEESKTDKYKGEYKEMYFPATNANDFISVGAYKYGYYESQDKSTESYFSEWEKSTYLKIINKQTIRKKGIDYITYTYTDTNTNRQIKMVNALHGQMRYFVYAYIDTVAGKPDFANTFINTFDVSDTLIEGNIFEKKGKRFFADFTSKDSVERKSSIKNFISVTFDKTDIKNIQNAIDTINMKGDAAKIRTSLIYKLSTIDSADELIVPYLQNLYARFVDTAFLQIEILQALARQRTIGAYKAIKPIIATDIPISDNTYDMENLLYSFSDTLKLTKTLLPELIELTTLQEYRSSAYAIISQMKDSGIITVADYAAIHNRLITESRIEYKRTMATLTKEKTNDYEGGSDYDYEPSSPSYNNYNYGGYQGTNTGVFSSLLELTLPLVNSNTTMKTLSDKILAITDNNLRIALMPVLLKNNMHFQDSVYETLAKNKDFRISLYRLLAEAKKLNKFPAKYHNQREIIAASIQQLGGRFTKVDSTVLLKTQVIEFGKKKYRIHFYKFRLKNEENWMLYASDALPTDTSKLNDPKEILPFYSLSAEINETETEAKLIGDILFDNYIKYVRENNGGYYESSYGRGGGYDGYEGDY